jgi:hypothetical protein
LKLSLDHASPNRNTSPSEQSPGMTRRERDDLAALIRRREKIAIADVKERTAALNAEIEARLSADFAAEDALWADVNRAAEAEVAKADAEIARRCEEIGVPSAFRPHLRVVWQGRGVNADPSRRSELRRLAQAYNAHQEKAGIAAIARRSVDAQTGLVAGGFTTDAARAFLAEMATADELLPALTVAQVRALLPTGERTSAQKRADLLAYGRWSPPELPEEARP